jgi:hypothetical protein
MIYVDLFCPDITDTWFVYNCSVLLSLSYYLFTVVRSYNHEYIISDSYDLLTVIGSYNHGHIPYDAIIQMIRLTKPGS